MSEDAKATRNQRLADALRANLKRRKAAVRPSDEPSARPVETLGDHAMSAVHQEWPGHENKG